MKNLKNRGQKGITLIALVVTIVVLIILATVSINTVIGDNGIISRAQKAKNSYLNSQKSEDEQMAVLVNEMSEYDTNDESSGEDDSQKDPTKDWDLDKVTVIDGGDGTKVPLPNGFYYVGGDISTGLVISDKEGDTLDASGTSMGNQFVWIPVSSEADLTRTAFDTNGQATTGLSTDYTEPYANGYSTEASEYTTMKTQVLKYGGFYIGRYEAGVNSTTLRTTYTKAQTVVCKKGVAPYNFVPWGTSMSDASEISGKSGAVYLAKNMYSSSSSVTSTITYGCQWDAMCRYIGDSQRTTPTKSSVTLTGSVSTDVSKNIYDLAGNCREWTIEASETTYRVRRGGFASSADSINYRNNDNLPTGCNGGGSFRPTLYIK